MSAEPTADCTFEELARVVDENCEPFDTLAQVNRFIKAASMLRRREPSELEQSGERISKRDLNDQITEARKAREILLVRDTGRVQIITPTDCLD